MLAEIYIPESIVPRFNLDSKISGIDKTLINVHNGSCTYTDTPVLYNINLTLNAKNKIVIHGANGSGKSTLIKSLLNDNFIRKSGDWQYPGTHEIGYLDQHYSHFNQDNTAVELLQNIVPAWSHADIRDHLNSFLLRKNEEVNIPAKYLSGGEKVRLSLALIAAQVPKLLLLDEITNNIDLETKEHLINVLNEYPGAYILICHDTDFINQLNIDIHYEIKNGVFNLQ
jgi:ATPase subunit of ABC transporter with duplicated ATPase domains